MAGNARLVAQLGDFEQHHIVVAIEADVVHGLHMARLFAFEPQLVAGTTEVHRALELRGFFEGFSVHPSKHQHIAGAGFLGDDGHQALRVPLNLIKPIHALNLPLVTNAQEFPARACAAWLPERCIRRSEKCWRPALRPRRLAARHRPDGPNFPPRLKQSRALGHCR